MNVSELRFGNLIYKFGIDYIGENPVVDRNDFEVIKVDLSVLKNILDFDGTTNFYYTEPIPLTEKWLLNLGAKFFDENRFDFDKNRFTFLDLTDNGFVFTFQSNDICEPIKYVHQLQNVYFALTQEELIFDL